MTAAFCHLLNIRRGEFGFQDWIVGLELERRLDVQASALDFEMGSAGSIAQASLQFAAQLLQIGRHITLANFAQGIRSACKACQVLHWVLRRMVVDRMFIDS